MALFAIVIALLLEQVRPLAPDNRAATALRRWVRAVGHNVDAGGVQHGWLAWALAAMLPAALVAAVDGALDWLVIRWSQLSSHHLVRKQSGNWCVNYCKATPHQLA